MIVKNKFFRAKFQYSSSTDTGDVVKSKTELLIQATNYTEAEAVVNKIIFQYSMDKYDDCDYEITRQKFSCYDIYATDCMQRDDHDVLGLMQHFFENDNDGLYIVNATVLGNKDMGKKDEKRTMYVTAEDAVNAITHAKTILKNGGNKIEDCVISSAKLDNAEYIYMMKSSSESIYERSANLL